MKQSWKKEKKRVRKRGKENNPSTFMDLLLLVKDHAFGAKHVLRILFFHSVKCVMSLQSMHNNSSSSSRNTTMHDPWIALFSCVSDAHHRFIIPSILLLPLSIVDCTSWFILCVIPKRHWKKKLFIVLVINLLLHNHQRRL